MRAALSRLWCIWTRGAAVRPPRSRCFAPHGGTPFASSVFILWSSLKRENRGLWRPRRAVVVAESTGGTRASGGPGPCRVGGCGRLEFEVGCWERGILGGLGRWCTKGLGGGGAVWGAALLARLVGAGVGLGPGQVLMRQWSADLSPQGGGGWQRRWWSVWCGGSDGVDSNWQRRYSYAGVAPKEARRSPVAGWPSLWLLGGVPKTLGWLPKRPGGHPWRGGRRYGCWGGSQKPRSGLT
jgi:hypothetical protein